MQNPKVSKTKEVNYSQQRKKGKLFFNKVLHTELHQSGTRHPYCTGTVQVQGTTEYRIDKWYRCCPDLVPLPFVDMEVHHT